MTSPAAVYTGSVKYTVQEASTNLERLIAEARAGQEVIIAQEDGSEVKLIATNPEPRKARVLGKLAGKISYSDDTFAPLTDQELKDLGFE